jgi:hypothetical protein
MAKNFTNKKVNHWKVYRASDGLFFFQGYNLSRGLRGCPTALSHLLVSEEPIGYATYKSQTHKSGSITTYLLKCSQDVLERVAYEEHKVLDIRDTKDISRYSNEISIEAQFISMENLNSIYISSTTDDIVDFCSQNSNVKNEGLELRTEQEWLALREEQELQITTTASRITKNEETTNAVQKFSCVGEKIDVNPQFSFVNPGKNRLVRDGKGKYFDICLIGIGFDFSAGCLTGTTSKGFYNPELRCGYCYATFQNGVPFLDTFYRFDERFLIEGVRQKLTERNLDQNKHLYFRFGQTTEAYVPRSLRFNNFQDNIKIALRAMIELRAELNSNGQDLSIAMPTKTLEFDPELVELFKEANVSVLSSIGYSQLEPGIINLGFPVERRLETILEYGKAGVKSTVYLATDITRPMEYMQPEAQEAFRFFQKHQEHLNLQILDIRITRKQDAPIIGGASWDQLLNSSTSPIFPDKEIGIWKLGSQNYLHAHITHPEFLALIGDNKEKIRLCSTHVKKKERRCGRCFM